MILVDDFTRQCFVKLLKNKTQHDVAEALDAHFDQQRPFSTGVKGVNFYVRNTVLRSDRGSEFINACALPPASTCVGRIMRIVKGISSGNMTLKVKDGS